MNKVLVVAAHPDDEVLGCGGTIARHAVDGDDVSVVFLADGIASRLNENTNEEIIERRKAANNACHILGVNQVYFHSYPDNRMDTIALLDIVQSIEKIINAVTPSIIYTHHGGDLNIDHCITNKAVMTACRPQPNFSVTAIYTFEVLSSTEWNSPDAAAIFFPNHFVDISSTLDKKMAALNAYLVEMRKYPHARSIEAVEVLAKHRGASMGMYAAEAFVTQRTLIALNHK